MGTPDSGFLFKVQNEAPKLSDKDSRQFHTTIVQSFFLRKR